MRDVTSSMKNKSVQLSICSPPQLSLHYDKKLFKIEFESGDWKRANKSSKLALSFLLRIRILLHFDWSKMRYLNLLNNSPPPFLKGGGAIVKHILILSPD